MKLALRSVLMALAATLCVPAGAMHMLTPGHLGDPVALNIGLTCQWNEACISAQSRAMKKSLKYVAKYNPPQWRIHQCNRNASRGRMRVDWIGFDACVRNENLRYVPPPPVVQSPRKVVKPYRRLHRTRRH